MRPPERQAHLPPAVTVHGLPHARIALAPGRPVLLLSGPGAAAYAGAGWWRAMVGHALAAYPHANAADALDCADLPGRALEALAAGCRMVVLEPCPAWASVADRADGALILPARPPSLDLADPAAHRHLDRWLAAPWMPHR